MSGSVWSFLTEVLHFGKASCDQQKAGFGSTKTDPVQQKGPYLKRPLNWTGSVFPLLKDGCFLLIEDARCCKISLARTFPRQWQPPFYTIYPLFPYSSSAPPSYEYVNIVVLVFVFLIHARLFQEVRGTPNHGRTL